MEKIKIRIKIKNKNSDDSYVGIANLNRDIIECSSHLGVIIYDKRINRLIKKDEEKKVTVDFNDKKINIDMKSGNLIFDINVIELYSSDELIKAIYKLDEETFLFSLEILGGCNE